MITGLTSEPVEGGLQYLVAGNSTDYGWKLTAGHPALLWTNAEYQILQDCAEIRFQDISVSIDDSGQIITRYVEGEKSIDSNIGVDDTADTEVLNQALKISHDGATIIDARDFYKNPVGDTFDISKAWARTGTVDILENGFLAYRPASSSKDEVTFVLHDGHWNTEILKVRVEDSEAVVEVGSQLIPSQLDEIGAGVNLDVGSFITDHLLDEKSIVQVNGLPPGLSYDSTRMRIEGTVSEDVITGQPYRVSVVIHSSGGHVISTSFEWTVRDSGTVDQSKVMTLVVPAQNTSDDAASAAVLFTVASQAIMAARSFSLNRSEDYSGGRGVSSASPFELARVSSVLAQDEALSARGSAADDLLELRLSDAGAIVRDEGETTGQKSVLEDIKGLGIGGKIGGDLIPRANDQQSVDLQPEELETSGDSSGGADPDSSPFLGAPQTVTTAEDTARNAIDILTSAYDPEGDVLNVVSASAAFGLVEINGDNTLNYVPPTDFNGLDVITYSVSDPAGNVVSSQLNIDVTPVNDAPLAGVIGNRTVTEDGSITVDVLATATDVDGDTLVVVSANVSDGSVSINNDGTITYNPNPDFNGTDVVNYTIEDGNGGMVSSTVGLSITPVNDAPSVQIDTASVPEDGSVTIDVLANDMDVDGAIDLSSVQLAGTVTPGAQLDVAGEGRWTVDPANGAITFTPLANYAGPVSDVSYTVADVDGAVSTPVAVSITLVPVNDAPVTADDTGSGPEDTALLFDVLLNDTDIDSALDPATIQLSGTAMPGDSLVVAGEGVWSVNGTAGTVTFTPEPDFNGTVTPVTYTVRDIEGLQSTPATLMGTLTSVNDAPEAGNPPPIAVDEDTVTAPINVLSFATDVDGDTVSISTITPPNASNGMVVVNPDGTLTYTPAANFNGTDTINYTLTDGNGGTVDGIVSVTVNSVNDVPLAGNPSPIATNEDTAINLIDVLSSASDLDGDVLTVTTATAANGAVVINPDGTLSYTPTTNFNGPDTISYTIDDGSGGTTTGSVDVTVNDINDIPVAAALSDTVVEDGSVNFDVVAGASDVDGTVDPTSVAIVGASGPGTSHVVAGEGTWTVNATTGAITFTPEADYAGPVTDITYTVNDDDGDASVAATLSVNIAELNDVPIAADLSDTVVEDDSVNFDVVASASDVDGTVDPTSVAIVGASGPGASHVVPGEGTWTVNATTGAITFTPEPDYAGPVTDVSYTVNDDDGDTSVAATLTVNIAELNDVPVAAALSDTIVEDGSVNFDVVASASDVDGTVDSTSVAIVGASGPGTSHVVSGEGTWTVNATSGVITFTPEPDYAGPVTDISYTVNDDDGDTSVAAMLSVLITEVNDIPVAAALSDIVVEDGSVDFDVVASASDVDGTVDPTTVAIVGASGPGTSHTVAGEGVWSVNATTGVITFTPEPDYAGPVTDINYTVNDDDGDTSIAATLSVSITETNDAPVAATLSDNVVEDGSVNFDVVASASDVDGTVDSTTVTIVGASGPGTSHVVAGEGVWTVNATTGVITFTPEPDYAGLVTDISYTVNDDDSDTSVSATLSVSITEVNDIPIAADLSDTVVEDDSVNFDVVASASDVDGTVDPTTVAIVGASGPGTSHVVAGEGTWAVNATTGVITFTPEPAYAGPVTDISYTVNDDDGDASVAATLSVLITEVNDIPVAAPLSDTVIEDGSVNFDVVAGASDVDGTVDPTTVAIVGASGPGTSHIVAGEGTWTVNATTGVITFTPEPDYAGPVTDISYTVNDDDGDTSAAAMLSVSVTEVNDIPVAAALSDTVVEDGSVNFDVIASASDVDGTVDPTTVAIVGASGPGTSHVVAGEGTWTVNATSGVIAFTPEPDYAGPVADISYTVNDDDGDTSIAATLSVSITEVNDIPVAAPLSDTVIEDGSVNFDVVASASDVDGTVDPTTVAIVGASGPGTSHVVAGEGTWTVNAATGVITFAPEPDYAGPVTDITYTVNDDDGDTSIAATLSVSITEVNDIPVAAPLSDTVIEDGSVNFDVVASASDVDGTVDPTTVAIVGASGPGTSHTVAGEGVWSVNATTGVITFAPEPDYAGPATDISYTINDDDGGTSVAAILSVSITDVNDIPLAADLSDTAVEDGSVAFDVVANASDVDGTVDPTTVTIVGASGPGTSHVVSGEGTWTVNATTGVITFTPEPDYAGPVTDINYTVNDNDGGTSVAVMLSVSITEVNDPPVASNITGSANEEAPIVYDVLGNVSDVDGTISPATVAIVGASGPGTSHVEAGVGIWTVNASTGEITFTPEPDYDGPVSPIQYTVTDDDGAVSNAASITHSIIPVNDVPTLDLDASGPGLNYAATYAEGGPNVVLVDVDVAAIDAEDAIAEINITMASLYDGPSERLHVGGLNFALTSNSSSSTTVGGVAVSLTYTAATRELVITPSGGPGATLTAAQVETVLQGVAYSNLSSTPDTTDRLFSIFVRDDGGDTSSAAVSTISVTSSNVAPAASDITGGVMEDTPTTYSVGAYVNDPDGTIDFTTVRIVGASGPGTSHVVPGQGTWTINPVNGAITFTPEPDYDGAITPVQYTVQDNESAVSNPANVNYTMLPQPDAPTDIGFSGTAVDENAAAGTLVSTLSTVDPDTGDTFTYAIASDPSGYFEISGDQLQVAAGATLDHEVAGTHDVTIEVTDSDGLTYSEVVTITINDVNEAPFALVGSGNNGTSINTDGGNAAYYQATNGGALMGGLSEFTFETQFAIDDVAGQIDVPLTSYHTGESDDEFQLSIVYPDQSGTPPGPTALYFEINNAQVFTSWDASSLLDGNQHTVSFSWENASGDWVIYADGIAVESGTGHQVGATLSPGGSLVFGNEQGSLGGGFQQNQVFSGTFYDIRLFDDVRTPAEVSAGTNQTLPVGEPNILANWRFGEDGNASIIDVVGGNDLALNQSTGAGWTSSTPQAVVSVEENSTAGTVVATLAASDVDASDTLSFSISSDPSGFFEVVGNELRVAAGATIDFETSTNHTVTVQAQDSGGLTTTTDINVEVLNLGENAPTDIAAMGRNGVSINADGGNSTFYSAPNSSAIFGGLTEVSLDVQFSIASTTGLVDIPLLNYIDGTTDELDIRITGFGGSPRLRAFMDGDAAVGSWDASPLLDGSAHTVSFTWNSAGGTYNFYVDGTLVDSGTGLDSGGSLATGGMMVLGQDQDSELGGFDNTQTLSGTLFDIRVFSDVRTPAEILAAANTTLPSTEPGLVANWLFDNENPSVITDAVSGNDLNRGNITGAGWNANAPSAQVAVAQSVAVGTVIATLSAADADIGDTFTYTILNDAPDYFDIVGDQLVVSGGTALNYTIAQSHSVDIQVQDAQGFTYVETFSVQVLNDNGVPPAANVLYRGTPNVDSLTGTADSEYFYAQSSDDTLNGGDGADKLHGQDGNDTLNGGDGADRLYGDREFEATDSISSISFLNTHATGNQSPPKVVALADGHMLVVWYDEAQNDKAGNVRAQFVEPDGTKVGPQLTIGTTPVDGSNNFEMPPLDAVRLENGTVIISWQTEQSFDRDGKDQAVVGVIVDTYNYTAGPEFLVNTTGDDRQSAPSLTALDDGRVLVVWYDKADKENDNGSVLFGQFINPDGSDSGSEFNIGTTAVGGVNNDDMPPLSTTKLVNGNVLVTWQSIDGPNLDGDNEAVVGAIVNSATGIVGSEFVINTTAAGSQSPPHTIALANGGAFVTWYGESDKDGNAGMTVYGQYLNADGSLNGGEVSIGTAIVEGDNAIDMPPLTALENADGDVLVSWVADDSLALDGSFGSLVKVLVNSGTQTAGVQSLLNTTTSPNPSAPVINLLHDGRMFATWYGNGDADNASNMTVFGQFLNADGSLDGAELLVSSFRVEGDDAIDMPPLTATMTMNGDIFVSWATNDSNNYDGDGSAVVSVLVSTATTTGDDVLNGEAGNDYLSGGDGNDTLDGGTDDDTLVGGNGNDTLIGGAGADAMDGGAGVDTVVYSAATAGVDLLMSDTDAGGIIFGAYANTVAGGQTGDAAGDTYANIESIIGTAFDDRIYGTGDALTADLGSGDDLFDVGLTTAAQTVDGGAGGDIIHTSAGDDIINAGADNDSVNAAGGDDLVNGDAGDDYLYGRHGADTLNGGIGNDTLDGGIDADIIDGGAGTDQVTFSQATAGVDVLFEASDADGIFGAYASTAAGGQAGEATGDTYTSIEGVVATLFDDQIYGTSTGMTANLRDGDDRFDNALASTGIDAVDGGQGNDLISTGGGDDALLGGAGDDILTGGAGADTINGGTGQDTASFANATSGVVALFEASDGFGINGSYTSTAAGGVVGDAAGDLYFDIEGIQGSDHDDQFYGTATGMTVDLGSGNDVFDNDQNGTGADIVNGGQGNDFIDTGDGDDTLEGGGGADSLNGGFGNDTVTFANATAGVDVLFENTDANGLWGAYSSTLAGGQTGEATGDSYSLIEAVIGSDHDDRIYAFADGMVADLGDGNDTYDNDDISTGVDIVDGGAGDDIIATGDGDDILIGGAGADLLHGEVGFDTVSFASATAGVDALFGDTDAFGMAGLYINTAAGGQTGDAAGDTYTAIEAVVGSAFNDRIYGHDAGMTVDLGDGNDVYDVASSNTGVDIVSGGIGNDVIHTSGGDDQLDGGAGNDLLSGAGGNDTIDGGVDSDTVQFFSDRVNYDVHQNPDGSYVVTVISGPTMWEGSDTLINVEFLEFTDQTVDIASAVTSTSPIAFDLTGDGEINVTGETTAQDKLSISEIGSTVNFDMDGDGDLETIEWLDGTGDGLLVDNRDGNAVADMNGARLFGDQDGAFEHGYQQLAELDANADNVISGEELDGLELWVDDGDAEVDEGELITLEEMGVVEISLELDENATDGEGRNLFQSSATRADGSSIMTEDVWFAEAQGEDDEEIIRPQPIVQPQLEELMA